MTSTSQRILYIFPHPDDESFGPAPAIAHHRESGHSVSLLVLTKGGATKMRHKLNLSIEEMGDKRAQEMQCVKKVLGLERMTILDLPDSGLKYMDPRDIEAVIKDEIREVQPDIVVTYPVHGISGFHDHIVSNAVVTRVFCELQGTPNAPKRLAFFTDDEAAAKEFNAHAPFTINFSSDDDIDCAVPVSEKHQEAMRQALDCYITYKEVIEKTRIRELVPNTVVFELFNESFDPPLTDLTASLPNDPDPR